MMVEMMCIIVEMMCIYRDNTIVESEVTIEKKYMEWVEVDKYNIM